MALRAMCNCTYITWETASSKPQDWTDKAPASPNPSSDKKGSNPLVVSSSRTTSGQPQHNPNLASKLGKDSKLTPQERQHCFDNNLCLFCGKVGHLGKKCLKAAVAAKACATWLNPHPANINTYTYALHSRINRN